MNSLDLIEETANIYTFLLNVLIDIFVFSDFDICKEEPFFTLTFSNNSSVRKYLFAEDQSMKLDGLKILIFLEKEVVSYKIFLETHIAIDYKISNRCVTLGYKDGFKVFTSKKDVLEECLRIENAFVESAPRDLNKSKGECLICNIETTLLSWPCHNSHTICEQCTTKIVEKNCVCPFCRSVLPTSIILKEDRFEEYSFEEDSFEEDSFEEDSFEEDYYWGGCLYYYCLYEEEDYYKKCRL